jgi:hypothetical protein
MEQVRPCQDEAIVAADCVSARARLAPAPLETPVVGWEPPVSHSVRAALIGHETDGWADARADAWACACGEGADPLLLCPSVGRQLQ